MSEGKVHALLAPSAADRWLTCLGSTALVKDLPEETSPYAVEGTDYHEVAAVCLDEGTNAPDYDGREMLSGAVATLDNLQKLQDGYIEPARVYAEGGTLRIEEELPLNWYTMNPDDKGTSDSLVIREDRELVVNDLKFGMGVTVEPDHNRQCMIYAISAIEKHGLWEEVDTVRIVISQPRVGEGKPREWVVAISELKEFRDTVVRTASQINAALKLKRELPLVPSEKACKFCKARATCPALTHFVDEAMTDGFTVTKKGVTMEDESADPLERANLLGRNMDKTNLVEIWMNGVRSQVEVDMLQGLSVIGKDGPYKLVLGKKGNRKWTDKEAVEELFKSYRLKQSDMYSMEIISPTDAEKLLKKPHPGRWKECNEFVTQSEGSKHVAPATDKRPAIVQEAAEDGFEVAVAVGEEDLW